MKAIKETIDGVVYLDLVLSSMDMQKLLDHFAVEKDIEINGYQCSLAIRTQLQSADDEIDQMIELEAKYYATNKEHDDSDPF